jgi:hypothetical protein
MVILLGWALSRESRAEIDAIVPGARVVSEADLEADPSLVGRMEIRYAHLPSGYEERADRAFLDNLRSCAAGRPLEHVVDKEAGY